MLTFLVIVSHNSRRTSRSLRRCSNSHLGTHPTPIQEKSSLSFYALTNCPFCNPFIFISLRTLLRFFVRSQNSNPFFSSDSALCVKKHNHRMGMGALLP